MKNVVHDGASVVSRNRILLSAREAAQLLGLSVSGFVRLGLPRVKFGRRAVRYQLSEIERLIAKRILLSRSAAPKRHKQMEVGHDLLS